MHSRAQIGQTGEACAAAYLQKQGYKLYARNVRLGRDEIDIIAFDPRDRVLVFTEVKSRSHGSNAYPPELNMTPQKLRRLRRAMRAWVSLREFSGGYRLDFIAVSDGRVQQHVEQLDLE
jgi:putative endonuclease